jgi:hypothetical protein
MGTEYCLGKHGEVPTPAGNGISLMAYEMSGTFDVYVDIPREKVDMEAWDNAARVNLWEKIDPADLFNIGLNIMQIAKRHLEQ